MSEEAMDRQSAAAEPSSQPKKRKHKQRFNRSKTGCLSCRRRRIRCDELHPVCERCSEGKVTCEWPSNDTTSRTSRAPSSAHSNGYTSVDGNVWQMPMQQGFEWTQPVNGNEMSGNGNGMGGNSIGHPRNAGGALASSATGINGVADINGSFGCTTQSSFHPLNALSSFANTLPWTTAMYGHTSWANAAPADPSATTVNLLNLFASESGVDSQTASRPPSPPPAPDTLAPPTVPAPLPSRTTLSLSQSSHLASRRRVAPSPVAWASVTIPNDLPPILDEPIENVFPSSGSKRLFQHVKAKTSTVIVALGNGDHRAKNPFMAMATRLMLLETSSHAQTAFRHSLLSLASAHVANQLDRASPTQSQEMRVRTVKSKRKSLLYLSIDTQHKGYTDLLLATCLTLFLRDKLYADDKWKEGLDTALTHIMRCAGPTCMLQNQKEHGDRRFLLEQIAVADLFSTFSTGDVPKLAGHGTDWWEETARTATESQWESYERFIGICRGMTEMLAKYRILVARFNKLEDEKWLQGKAGPVAREALVSQASEMLDTLKNWSVDQVSVPARKRIMSGNSAYRYMMVISLSVELLSLDVTDATVQTAVQSILELCSEMSQEPLNLIWPLLTAGACAGPSDRARTRQLFALLGDESSRDVAVARDLLHEQWTRLDCGNRFTPWPILMKDLQVQVCLV